MNRKKWVLRFGIICFWMALITALLYFPKVTILPRKDKSINVFSWGDILDPQVIANFESSSGIKVHINYYASNEELLVKLKATQAAGYDLIIPSDYAVYRLIQENLLKEIDKSKLGFLETVNPLLMGHFYDPENHFSLPFSWELFGLGVDRDYFEQFPFEPTWGLIYDPALIHYKIAMINDPLEVIPLTAFYLFHKNEPLNEEKFQQVRELLLKQRPWVEAYADFRGDYFIATKNCPVAVASSSYISRSKKMFPFIQFVIPKEGTFITIENLCIPINSKKEKWVYELINYLYRPESVAKHFDSFGFFPATVNALDLIKMDQQFSKYLFSTKDDFRKYHFFKKVYPQQPIRDLWIEVKSY